jgi:hypothetical protein
VQNAAPWWTTTCIVRTNDAPADELANGVSGASQEGWSGLWQGVWQGLWKSGSRRKTSGATNRPLIFDEWIVYIRGVESQGGNGAKATVVKLILLDTAD